MEPQIGRFDFMVAGLNVDNLPKHVQEAIAKLDLRKDALARAKAGAEWLDTYAPPDWRLQMVSISKGVISPQVRMHRNDENPLALAFRRVPGMRGADHRCTWAIVSEALGFVREGGKSDAARLGFIEKDHVVNDVIIRANFDAYFLNEAWATVLGELEWPSVSVIYPDRAAKLLAGKL